MNTKRSESNNIRPFSSSNFGINLFCLMLFFLALFICHSFLPEWRPLHITIICLLAVVIPLGLYDFFLIKVQKRFSTGLRPVSKENAPQRLITKLIALYGTFLIIYFYYYVIYTYFNATYLKDFFHFLTVTIPWILPLCFLYFWMIDRRQKNPFDEYWHVGCFLTGRFKKVNPAILKEYVRSWFIKGFFIPYMFVLLVRYVETLIAIDWTHWNFMVVYSHFLDLFYTVDLIYGVLGYILTLRLLDTHIRSTEPTLLGWVVCLMCYGPFHEYFGIGLLTYDDGSYWTSWLASSHVSYYFCGGAIILFSLIYGLATVAIGYRMSNLTYRGIITSGPYRFSKHPAYICKIASWWLISLPFFSMENPFSALKHTLALSAITVIYYLRAKTEENHLSNYPEYVAYANWMNTHGIFSCITRYFPFLQYSQEKSKRWKSIVKK